jgi:hypothetical protein
MMRQPTFAGEFGGRKPLTKATTIQSITVAIFFAASLLTHAAESETKLQSDNGTNRTFQPNAAFTSQDLWLEILNQDRTNYWPRMHNTVYGENYQLLSITNLSSTNWDLGELYIFAFDRDSDFSPIPMTNSTRFFRVHHAMPILYLWDTRNAIMPNAAHNDPGRSGIITLWNETGFPSYYPSNDITVHYTISGGTAQSGIDYSNLSGVVTIPAGEYSADINIYPIENGLKPEQTVILKLEQNTNFLIDPDLLLSTNILYPNSGVAGPILTSGCDPFATAPLVQLNWSLNSAVQQMQQHGLSISEFIIYRGSTSGGPYTAIETNAYSSPMSYSDTNIVVGQTNYYVVTFVSSTPAYESLYSNEIVATGHNPDNLIAPDAIWSVQDIATNRPPFHMGPLRAPFSYAYPNQYADIYPLPNNFWPLNTTWSNHIALYIPTNTVLSQVKYAIAVDSDYRLYLNHSTNYIDSLHHTGNANWSSFKSFESVAPGLLHYGNNDIDVVIQAQSMTDYFSMVVTTNTCGR